jgi:hypothetical protein
MSFLFIDISSGLSLARYRFKWRFGRKVVVWEGLELVG